jgi:hypothetical protein
MQRNKCYYLFNNNNKTLIDFFNEISYKECQIMSIAYHNIFLLLGLEYYTDNKMILNLYNIYKYIYYKLYDDI